ncbi:MAG TPA: DUF4382 domain-containing protein [Gammaproteobacteria bacterium]|nr:DUF4382 domain-containing protein [Gammaproteobacteria bacterium]
MYFRHTSLRMARSGAFALMFLLTACGGSSSSTGTATTDCTQPSTSDPQGCTYVSFTDAPGDFLTYTVTITSLSLTRTDGTVVNLLPKTTTVDFAQYDDLSEFLTLATMPIGTYKTGTITVDYSSADIEVEDNSGNAVQVKPVDQTGKPITALTLALKLDSQGDLTLVPGVPQLFQVDFNLDASNTVDLTTDTVTVQPFLTGSINPNLDNQVRVRGPLATVDSSGADFTLNVRPFAQLSGDYGGLRVFTTDNTVFDIDQTPYSGNAGLTALAAAGADTAVVAKGSFNFNSDTFIATEVDAGSSVPGGTLDAAEGVVLSRSADSIVLRGATLYRAGQTATFHDSVAVTLASTTKVHEAGSPKASFDISDISVGQRLLVFGKLTNTNSSSLALDASSGFARLLYTRFDGTVSSAPVTGGGTASMGVQMQYIEGRPVSMFNFTGTGTSTLNDADPTNYSVSAAGGILNGIALNDPVRVWGFVTPFGSAPPDFNATSVADYIDARARLVLAWPSPGTANAFTSMSSISGIVLNLASSPLVHEIRQGGIVTQLATAPTIQGTLGVFAIDQNGIVQTHVTLDAFLSDLTARMTAGAKIRLFYAGGGYTGSTATMKANLIAVILQ